LSCQQAQNTTCPARQPHSSEFSGQLPLFRWRRGSRIAIATFTLTGIAIASIAIAAVTGNTIAAAVVTVRNECERTENTQGSNNKTRNHRAGIILAVEWVGAIRPRLVSQVGKAKP
jgi:hypothetical protein